LSSPLLTSDLIEQVGRLDLVAKMMVEGFLIGRHQSPYHGFSSEFAEYRQYIPGESTANIDWRLYAKTDRHYLRVFTEETNLRATMLVDCSASMEFTSDAKRPTKKVYAAHLAAALTYMLLHQNDAVGLITFDEAPINEVSPRSMKSQLFQILKVLDTLPKGEKTDLGSVLHDIAAQVRRRGLILVFSDLMSDLDALMAGLNHFRYQGHEVVVFHILDPAEVSLDYSGDIEFEDLEQPGTSIRCEPAHGRQAYMEAMAAWRTDLRDACHSQHIDLVEMTTDQTFDQGLGAYLHKRRRMY
jgi:uncharacterized protein (DUF58 family)